MVVMSAKQILEGMFVSIGDCEWSNLAPTTNDYVKMDCDACLAAYDDCRTQPEAAAASVPGRRKIVVNNIDRLMK